MAERVRATHSLRLRLVLLVGLGGFLLVLAMTAASYALARRILLDDAYREVEHLAQLTGVALQSALQSPETTLRTLGDTVGGVGYDPEELRALLRATMSGDRNVMGAMLAMDAGALAPRDPLYSCYLRRDGSGFHEQSMMRDYDFRDQAWYRRTLAERRPWWSEPYANAATGGELVSTVNLALPGGNGYVPTPGMVSLDVPVARMRALVENLQRRPGTRAFLLSPQGRYVVHPDAAVALRQTLASYIEAGRSDLAPMEAARREGRGLDLHHVATSTGARRYTVFMPLGERGWSFGLSVDESQLLKRLDRATRRIALGGLAALLVMTAAVLWLARRVSDPLAQLARSARHFGQGDFEQPPPHTARRDEVGLLARALDRARGSIKLQMREIEQLAMARQKLDSELGIAREIQLALLPRGRSYGTPPRQLEVGALLEPAKSVGGDFYNFFEREPGKLWFMIGDVSDKGIPAALFMVRVLTLLEHSARAGARPDAALREAAQGLVEGNDACMFATVLCGLIDLHSGHCSLASAGHEAPLLLGADGSVQELPTMAATPLGFEVAERYPAWEGVLAAGQTLLCYTDGITEAFDPDNQAFGEARLRAALAPALGAEALCRRLVAAVHDFAGAAPQSDDITVLAIRAGGEAGNTMLWTLKNDRAQLASVCGEFEAALAAHGLDAARRHDALLIVEEVLCNVLDHGFDPDAPGQVTLRLAFDGPLLELEFRDNGRPFDPLAQAAPDLDADIVERPVGGLGVHLIKELSQSAHYRREGMDNVLSLTLNISAEELPQ